MNLTTTLSGIHQEYYYTDPKDLDRTYVAGWEPGNCAIPPLPPHKDKEQEEHPKTKEAQIPSTPSTKMLEPIADDLPPLLFCNPSFDDSRKTYGVTRNILPITTNSSPPEKFRSPIEALSEAIEQIRILKLGTDLMPPNNLNLTPQISSLDREVKRTLKILSKTLPKNGLLTRDLLIQQRNKLEPDLNAWTSKTARLKNSVSLHQLIHSSPQDPLYRPLQDLQAQIDLIQSIFSHKIFRR
jgi:hypothetical protein